MIVIDLGMTNIITNLLPNHIFLPRVPAIILPHLAVHPNFILVLANAPLAIITPLLNKITLLTVLLLNHVMIAIVVDHTQTQNNTLHFKINPLLTLLNRLHQSSITLLLQNPNWKLICITLLLHHNILHFLMNMLMLIHLQLGLSIYTFSNPMEIPPYPPTWNYYFYSITVHLSVF